MKGQWKWPETAKMWQFLGQYKYVLIVIAVGIALLLLPSGGKKRVAEEAGIAGAQEDFNLEELETKLSQTLSQVEGAGQVTVTLTVKSGMEQVLASDRSTSVSGDNSTVDDQTVVLSTGSGEEAVLITTRYPTFQGALVVCQGADNPEIRLLITQAVASLTGLGSDRITVCKGT